MTEKVTKLVKGGVVGIVAGVFLIAFLAMLMHAIAWLLNDLFFGDNVWAGFLVEAGGDGVLEGAFLGADAGNEEETENAQMERRPVGRRCW